MAFNTTKSLRRYQFVGYVSLFVMIGAVGAWSAVSNINGAVIAPAVVTVESFTKKIQHRDGGIVKDIRVVDGDTVTEGQELVVLDDTDTRAELGIVDALLLENITKRARLEAQRDGAAEIEFPPDVLARQDDPEVARIISGQRKLFTARQASIQGKQDQLGQQIAQLNEQIAGLVAQRDSKTQQIKLIREELKGLNKLLKNGLVPQSRVLAMERELARLEGELGQFASEIAAAQGKIGEVKIQMIQIAEEDRSLVLTELRDAESKIAEFKERQIAASSKLARTVIKAPLAGTVYQSSVHTIGGVIAPGEVLMLITPEGDDLVLQAQISPADVDQVQKGQHAIIRFSSIKDRLTPELGGEVVNVATDTSQSSAETPPFYAVRVKLLESDLPKLGKHKLRPGMPAEAFIQTDRRTVLSYFLKPLLDQLAVTFREH